jgi:hypothetical protein
MSSISHDRGYADDVNRSLTERGDGQCKNPSQPAGRWIRRGLTDCRNSGVLDARDANRNQELPPLLEIDSSLKRDHAGRRVSSESHAEQPGRW